MLRLPQKQRSSTSLSTRRFNSPRTTQATTALNHEQPLDVGDRIEIGGQAGIVRTVQPLLGELELRLVVQLLVDRG
jgi:hypothetical protein